MAEGLIPTEAQIYSWIEEVFAQGVRRPGYPADVWAERHCFDRLTELGLENVQFEPVELTHWEPPTATRSTSRASRCR